MTTQELRSYIDRILGNSLRVLLPSYWWKRLFGMTIDAIESLPDKKYVDNAVSNVKVMTDSEMSATSTNAVQNRVIKQYVDNKAGSCVVHFPISGGTLTADQIRDNAASYKRLADTKLISEVLVWSLLGYTKAITVVAGTNGISIATLSSKAVLHEDGSVTDYVEQSSASTLTFVAAFDPLLNDVTTDAEKAANKANARTYNQGITEGKEYKIDFKAVLRLAGAEYPMKVTPSYIGPVSLYQSKYNGERGGTMVFAKLDFGDEWAGMTYDLMLNPDSGYDLVPHTDMYEINLLHVIIESDIVTSEGLSNVRLRQNQEIYWCEHISGKDSPVAVYVTNKGQLLPARVYTLSGSTHVIAGDYEFKLNSDGTVEHMSMRSQEAATKAYVDNAIASAITNTLNTEV